MPQNLNTARMKPAKMTETEIRAEQREIEKTFMEDDFEEITIPKALSGKISNPFYWALNGVVVGFELGVPKKVPKSIATHVKTMLNEIK